MAKGKLKNFLIFAGIICLAAFLRLWALTEVPPGFTPDEAAQGYTAYSILKTGRDEWGEFLPASPRSFGDFKPPLYTYLLVPFIAFFGLNEMAVRLPAALAGILSVGAIFLLVQSFLRSKKMGLLAAFLAAVNPWQIQLSRFGFEGSLLNLFIPLGIWLFLKEEKDTRYLFISVIPFVLSVFAYHPAKIVIPLMVPILIFWRKKALQENSKFKIACLGVWTLIFLTVFLSNIGGGASRAADIVIFNPTDKWAWVFERRIEAVKAGLADPISRLFNNKVTGATERIVKNYLQYFSPSFLFGDGPAEGFYGMIPGVGVFYVFDIVFILAGVFLAVYKKNSFVLLMLALLLISPLPASLTKGPGYAANRAVTMIPFLIILSAYGGGEIFAWSRRQKFARFLQAGLVIWMAFSCLFFLEKYFIHSRFIIATPMQFGWQEVMTIINRRQHLYENIIVSRSLSEPQAYVMFYSAYDPRVVQKESAAWRQYQDLGLKFLDQLGEYRLGKFVFRHLHYPVDRQISNAVLIGKPEDFLGEVKPLMTVNYPAGQPAFYLVETEGE